MFNVLAPSIAILNRLKFTHKFALIFALYLVPVFYVAYVALTEHAQTIHKTKVERQGLKYMTSLRPLFEHMAQTRGMTNAYLNGKVALKDKIISKRELVRKELTVLIEADTQFAAVLKTGNKAKSIQLAWSKVVQNAFLMKPAQAFAAHTAVIDQVLEFKGYLMQTSGLMLDPSLDSNILAHAVSLNLPLLVESMGKTRGLGAGIAANGSFTPQSYLKLAGLLQTVKHEKEESMYRYDVAFEENTIIREKLSVLREKSREATQHFIDVTNSEILNPEKIKADAISYFKKGTEAIAANLKLYDATLPALDALLETRISNVYTQVTVNIISSLGLLVAALILFGGFYKSLMTSINRIKSSVRAISDGDYTTEVKLAAQDEMQQIASDMNIMIEKTNALVGQVMSAANQVVITSEESVTASTETQDGVNKQNMELELVATAMNEMSATVHEVANNAASAAEATRNAETQANSGRTVVNQTIQSINDLSSEMEQASNIIKKLEEDSENIGTVLDVIKGIAEQTNLLALNAAIEAARAGEQGRGFAVVADEVRTLASRTQDSTEEINTMIEKLQQGSRTAVKAMDVGMEQTQKTVSHAAEAGSTLESITKAVDHITMMTEQIASAAEEQSSVAEEINRNVVNVRDVAVQTADNANKTTTNSGTLKNVASQLQGLVAEFKVN